MLKRILLVILFWLLLLFSNQVFAQNFKSKINPFESNWNVTFQIGRTALLSEVNTNFRGTSNDMNNLSDWGFNFQISKMVVSQLELGVEFGLSNYKGYKKNSANVNWLNLHPDFNNERVNYLPLAIYYDSNLTNFIFFGKYNFANFSTWTKGYLKLNLYAKIGIGIGFPSAELGFQDMASYELTGLIHPIYVKGRMNRPTKDVHNFFSPAIGLNYQLSDRIFFSAETSFQFIGADNLDGIHNYNRQLRPDVPKSEINQYRVRVYDLTAKFMVGITYYFNFDVTRQAREKQNPWFRKSEEFYYSKYHQSSTLPAGKIEKKKNAKKKKR